MRNFFLYIFFFCSLNVYTQDCPQTTGLYTELNSFNSYNLSVTGHWNSLLGTGVQHFLLNYKHVDSLQWNNLANLDSTSTSKIIPFLNFNDTYVWRVASYCSENYQNPAEWSVIDTFTTMQYIECPTPINTFSNNTITTETTAFIDLNWDSMLDLGVDHFLIRYKQIDSQNWTNISNMDSTFSSRTIGGDLNHNNFYVWNIRAYCSENQSYFSNWSTADTFYIGNFVPEEFNPLINLSLSSLVCEEPTDINLTLSQSANQPDIQSTVSSSNLGYIDLDNLFLGQNVGSASVTAGINNFIDNDYSLEVSDISLIDNSVTIDLVPVPINQSQISFEIYNLENGGIELSIVSPDDNNDYTSGNSLEITLEDIFINPSPSSLRFDVIILSELDDDKVEQFEFDIDCEINSLHYYDHTKLIYPNPTSSNVVINVNDIEKIKLFDISGNLVLKQKKPNNKIDVSQLSKGLYFLEIIFNGKRNLEQLIVR